MWNDWLAKANARHFELFELGRGKFRITFGQKTDGIIHPFDLFIFRSADHATLADGTEQLIACAVGYRLLTFWPLATITLFPRQHYLHITGRAAPNITGTEDKCKEPTAFEI